MAKILTTGFYKKRNKIDWESFEIDCFIPHLFVTACSGCGANALSLLTGIHPDHIHNDNRKNPDDWKDKFMVQWLRQHQFLVQQITMCDVTNYHDDVFSCNYLNRHHVLLMSQLMQRNTASWSVVHNGLWYHNFQTCSFQGLNLINNPMLTCYLLKHQSWTNEIIKERD